MKSWYNLIAKKRPGATLLEILVAIAIALILLALLLPAVQKVRATASLLREKNKVKQIALAFHMYDNDHDDLASDTPLNPIHVEILPYLEQGVYYNQVVRKNGSITSAVTIPLYLNEDDPSLVIQKQGVASYCFNAQIHNEKYAKRSALIRDGMSNTLEITTAYACDRKQDSYELRRLWIADTWIFPPYGYSISRHPNSNLIFHTLPPKFANPYTGEVVPGSPEAQTLTFQLRPAIGEVNYRIPQSPYQHGLLAGLADGSVRMISPQISPRTFWAAVSPNGGEVLGPDW